jgi:hypothetical protein
LKTKYQKPLFLKLFYKKEIVFLLPTKSNAYFINFLGFFEINLFFEILKKGEKGLGVKALERARGSLAPNTLFLILKKKSNRTPTGLSIWP